MDLFSQQVQRSELQLGDHIYSWRKHIYSHHGIFIGEGKVIEFVNTSGGGGFRARFLSPFQSSTGSGGGGGENQKTPCQASYCKQSKVGGSTGIVRLSCIDCFLKEGSLCRFKYKVSQEFILLKSVAGTCTMAESDPPEEVIHRATYLYENGYCEYDQMNNNCEDFALYCKTGLWSTDIGYQGRSSQANMVRPTSRPEKEKDNGMVERLIQYATVVPRSYLKRMNKDLGVRNDVVKVPVEVLSSFRLSLN